MRPQPYRPPSVNAISAPQTPLCPASPLHLNYQQSSFGLPSPIPREFETYAYQASAEEEYGPPEPPLPKSYVIYDDEEEEGPSTREIIANQSQDYVDEKLAQYQYTIMQLQGELDLNANGFDWGEGHLWGLLWTGGGVGDEKRWGN